MARPSDAIFVHTVDLFPIKQGAGSDGGAEKQPARLDRPAIVDPKGAEVVDERASEDTFGTRIRTSVHVAVHLEDYVQPGSDILVHKGTPAERTLNVAKAAYFDHPDGPSHAELWGV